MKQPPYEEDVSNYSKLSLEEKNKCLKTLNLII